MDLRRLGLKNTKERGKLEFVIYPEGKRYIGVCLTLNIVEEGIDPGKLIESIKEAVFGHVFLVIKENLSDDLLNNPAADEYWERYFKALEAKDKQGKPTYCLKIPLTCVPSNA